MSEEIFRALYRAFLRYPVLLFPPHALPPGGKCLFPGDHAESIVGMPHADGRALIEELNILAVHPGLTCEHRWQTRELIVWDNRCVMHRATG